MNKHIMNALKDYEFTYGKKHGYGHINGYEVTVLNLLTSGGPIFFISTYLPLEKKQEFVEKIKSYKIRKVHVIVEPIEFGLVILIRTTTTKSFVKHFPNALSKILDTLESLEAPKSDICPLTGEVIDENNCKLVNLTDLSTEVKVRLSNEAVTELNTIIDEANKEYESAPNNYLKGFGGIALGGLVGAILVIIFSAAGYVTLIAPIVSIFLGVYLYKKFGGKQNIVMIVMSLLTTFIVIIGMLLLMYALAAGKLASDAGLAYRGFEALSYYVKNDPEFKRAFNADIILNIVFTVAAGIYAIFSLVKMIKRPKSV